MNNQRQELDLEITENEVCEACGCSAEMGFIIKEGDDVADVHIQGPNKATLITHLEPYLALAKRVNEKFEYQVEDMTDDATQLTAHIRFECSAEKLIFELQSRSLNR